MTEAELRAIEKREREATTGPWEEDEGDIIKKDGAYVVCVNGEPGHRGWLQIDTKDCRFIAHSREDIPKLIAALREARAAASKLADYAGGCLDPRTIEPCGDCGYCAVRQWEGE